MHGRSQRCYLEGSLSPALSTSGDRGEGVGVPQGSILGPLLYVIFTNEFSEVIHQHPCIVKDTQPWTPNLNKDCKKCGAICFYADDSTYSTSEADPDRLAQKISSKYTVMANFLSSSKLKVNDDKTHSLLLTTAQMRRRRNISVEVTIGTEENTPSDVEKLLGIHIDQNLKWGNHIMNNKKSLVKALTTRSNALAMVSKLADFPTRKMIANGIFHSKLCYCLTVFGRTENYLVNALQKIQTRVARLVCGRGRRYPAASALRQVGWLPVASVVDVYSLVQAKKVLESKKPSYLYEKLVGGSNRPAYATRLCVGGNLRHGPEAKLAITLNSWRWRVGKLWGEVPATIRVISGNMVAFKFQLKDWFWNRT